MIYLDNASTSFPKPPGVADAMARYIREIGASPSRAGHRLSVEAGRMVHGTRAALAELFSVDDPLRIILTSGATESLNLVIRGLYRPGDRIVTSSVEHNSVMRPLRDLERGGASVEIVEWTGGNEEFLGRIDKSLGRNVSLLILNHSSNVSGSILPVFEAAAIARERGITTVVDASQTAGSIPIDLSRAEIDLFVFTGHKGLLGPPGTGGVVLGKGFDPLHLRPLLLGGTGSRSFEEIQPDFLPDRYESGTPNTAGIAGLGEGIRFLLAERIENIREREVCLIARLLDGLRSIPGVTVLAPSAPEMMTPCVSFIIEGLSVSDIGRSLEEGFGILCRTGLHCAPSAHRTLGTFSGGAVRLSPGVFTGADEIEAALDAVKNIASR